MAIELATAYVSLVPTTQGIQAATATALSGASVGASKAGAEAGAQYGKAAAGGMSTALAGAVGIAAAAGAVSLVKDAVGEARESQKVGATTEAMIRSTGGAANVTADQMSALATAISNKTGVDDEAIQSSANLLFAYKNVANQAGEGSNIFDRATASMADLAAAGFGNTDSAAKALGKALNDPIGGLAGLSRAGITFTEQQKEQIATLTESGDVLGAQKLIMEQVEGRVGGVAEASATAGEKMSTAFGNFKETLGTALLPAIDRVESGLTSMLGFVSENTWVLGAAAAAVGFVTVAMVANSIATGVTAAGGLAAYVAQLGIVRGVTTIATAVQWLWNAALSANPIGLVIIAIAALIAIVVLLVKNWDTVKEAGARAWEWIKNAWSGAVDWFGGIGDAIEGAFKAAFNWVANGWNSTLGQLSWTIPDWVPGIGGNTISVPQIPLLASGAVVTGPTLAMIGEGNEPEAVMPLSRLEDMLAGDSRPTVQQTNNISGLGLDEVNGVLEGRLRVAMIG